MLNVRPVPKNLSAKNMDPSFLRTTALTVGFLLFASSCEPANSSPAKTPATRSPSSKGLSSSNAPQRIAVTYREAANLFEVLDNASMWLEDKCDPEYRAYWDEHFGADAEDKKLFDEYKAIRAKHYEAASPPKDILFGPKKPADRFAEAFYEADTIASAFDKLRALNMLTPEELATLERFYAHFTPKCATLLADSRAAYPAAAKQLQTKLAQRASAEIIERMLAFYGVTPAAPFDVLYIWWPPVDHTTANNRGRFVLLKYNPQKDCDELDRGDPEIPVHELTHWLSTQQSEERKQTLTKAFSAGCDIPSLPPPYLLEEPLAVAQQKFYLRNVEPERFETTSTWYGDSWVSTYSKLIYGHVEDAYENHRVVDETLMRRNARVCSELKKLGQKLNEAKSNEPKPIPPSSPSPPTTTP